MIVGPIYFFDLYRSFVLLIVSYLFIKMTFLNTMGAYATYRTMQVLNNV